MKYLIIVMVLLFAMPAHTNKEQELIAFINDFLRMYSQRRSAALSYIPTIINECKNDIDPLLIAVIISMESSWKFEAVGKRGELGLMQIMPKYAKKYNLKNPHEQIRASIRHYRRALTFCKGNTKDALNALGCGKCKPHLQFLKWRWRWYTRAIKKYRRN